MVSFYINYEECKWLWQDYGYESRIGFILTMRNVNWEDVKPVDKPVDVLY